MINAPEIYKTVLGKLNPKISLHEHTQDCIQEIGAVLSNSKVALRKYKELSNLPDGIGLPELLHDALLYHDYGKSAEPWSNACLKDSILIDQGEGASNLTRLGFRHEFASIILMDNLGISKILSDKFGSLGLHIIKIAILAHHRKLVFTNEVNKFWHNNHKGYNFEPLHNYATAISNTYISKFDENQLRVDKEKFKRLLNVKLQFSGLRALLQSCDHRASAKEGGNVVEDIKPFTYKFPYDELNNTQKAVKSLRNLQIALLQAGTGSGKTLAAYEWLDYQVKSGKCDRGLMLLPTRFTANSIAVDVGSTISDAGLYHSSSLSVKRKIANEYKDEKEKNKLLDRAKIDNNMAKEFINPLTITTVDQVLSALITTREHNYNSLFNLLGSALIFDEMDFYDPFTLESIYILLQFCVDYKIPVLIMSATLPKISTKLFSVNGLTKPLKIKNAKNEYSKVKRVKIHSKKYTSLELDLILEKAKGKTLIIYSNTIKNAIKYHRRCKLVFPELYEEGRILLHHSRFLEKDKEEKESKILELLGKNAIPKPAIVILTQIGEMSLNISSEMMISDICPIDRLAQRAGRLQRFNPTKEGDLYIITPLNDKKEVQTRPYTDSINSSDELHPFNRSCKIIESILGKNISPDKWEYLVNKVYDEKYLTWITNIKNNNTDIRKNTTNYYKEIRNSIIFRPNLSKLNAKNDKPDGLNWKSRDIQPEETLYITNIFEKDRQGWRYKKDSPPTEDESFYIPNDFKTYMEFETFTSENSLKLQPYLLNKIRVINTYIKVDDEIKCIKLLADTSDYDKSVGIQKLYS